MPVVHSRDLWLAAEPYHAVVYFAPEVREALRSVGCRGFWMGYFAARTAPMGPVPAEVVTATFFNFHPRMVARAIPDAWSCTLPEAVLAARLDALDAALRRLLGPASDANDLGWAASRMRSILAELPVAGRPLFAAHRSLPWPESPCLALWHAATLLREHRGDGHVAALVAEGVSGIEAHVLQTAKGTTTAQTQRANRGWSEEEWRAAEDELRSRGWLETGSRLTPDGVAAHARIEARTDALAAAVPQGLGDDTEGVLAVLQRCASPMVSGGAIPFPNPIALPAPR